LAKTGVTMTIQSPNTALFGKPWRHLLDRNRSGG
jgi:hypothetical protein